MFKKKVCMLGTLSVGKTSLVRRFVESAFDDSYKTTIGVKVDKKQVQVENDDVIMMLWDMEGSDKFQSLRRNHLRGAEGYLLVVDVTRPKSLEYALAIQRQVLRDLPDVPGQFVFNKCDLEGDWALDADLVRELDAGAHPPVRTSARTGVNVDEMFASLARRMLARIARERSA